MGNSEFHEILGKIIDSDQQDVGGILQAGNEEARKRAVREFADRHNITLDEQDLNDLARLKYRFQRGDTVTIMSPRG